MLAFGSLDITEARIFFDRTGTYVLGSTFFSLGMFVYSCVCDNGGNMEYGRDTRTPLRWLEEFVSQH